jgi:glycosyltransferase involved in cell wall biosynthesis
MSKKVSVLMSTYIEPEEWLKASIESILVQTFSDFEFIIINDNPSRPDLKKILKYFCEKDTRIKVIENPQNLGLTKSLNVGIEHSTGKYIARMDADDISFPDRLRTQIDFMEKNPDIGVCGTWAEAFGNGKGRIITPISDEDIRDTVVNNCPFIHPTVFMRNSLFDNPDVRYKEYGAEDYGLWVDLLGKTKFHNIGKVLIKYRISTQQFSYKNKIQKEAGRRVRQRAIKFIFGEEVVKEIFNSKEITLKKIKEIKSMIPQSISRKAKILLIENLYLSQGKYNFYASLYYLIRENEPKIEIFMKLIKRIFKHDKIYSRIITN